MAVARWGGNCYKSLSEQGYCVLAALDKHKSGDHIIEGLYTYKLGTEPDAWNKADCVVVVCLANGMIHKNVADELYSLGYSYIVFLPLNYCIDDGTKRRLTRIYNDILLADPVMTVHTVSDYAQYALPDMEAGSSIISQTAKHITVWMRLEMLFSESLELWKGDKAKIHTKTEYKDRNIACANPCKALFDYFELQIDSSDEYFKSRKEVKSSDEIKKELHQREALYRLFKREHDRGMQFFIEGAPEVVWNPRNYCNLVGGHHRTLFLLHEGHGLFPVKMRYDDFEKWHNETACQELKDYIHKYRVEKFYAPLPHPCFLNFPVSWEDTGDTKLAAVLQFFAHTKLAGLTVLDCSDDEGYFARNMERVGAKEVLFLNCNGQQTELAALFDRLLYREDVQIKKGELEELSGIHKWDVVFALENGNSASRFTEKLRLLGDLTGQYLLMETAKVEEIEKIRVNSGLKSYRCIHKEYKSGQIWELGVYSR